MIAVCEGTPEISEGTTPWTPERARGPGARPRWPPVLTPTS